MTTDNTTKQAPDVLCLHGSTGNGRQWQALVQHFGRRHRVVAPDLIGYGSKRFMACDKLSLDDEVDAVVAQLVGVSNPVHVVGHSYGGAVALRLACRYPERVASVTLYEPAQLLLLFEDGLHTSEARELRKLRGIVVDQLGTTFGRWRAARALVNYWGGGNVWKQLGRREKRRFAHLAPKVAAELDALLVSGARLGDLSGLTMPVNILCGTQTRRTAKRICENLAERIHGATLHWLDGLRHMAPVTHATQVNAVVASLLAA